MKRRPVSLAVVCLMAACASPRAADPQAPAHTPPTSDALSSIGHPTTSATILSADAPVKTSSGATFTGPKGWSVTRGEDRTILQDPERAITLTFLEEDEANSERATLRAWHKVDPSFSRAVEETTKPPAKDGWDEITQTKYATRDEEARIVLALARRKGQKHYVALIDGSRGGFDKRIAQLMTSVLSFKAAGVEEERFQGPARKLDAAALSTLESFIEDARTKANVPGLAVAVVQDGKVVFERGFGVAQRGQKAPVTPRTLFMIGSTTKSLTTLLMARLVDAKKLAWDTPLVEALPSFALGDEAITRRVTMRHTVCACTGMPRRDMEFVFEYGGVSAEARIASMHSMVPTTGFGETFQYSNLLVAAGGYGAAHVTARGKSLNDAYALALKQEVTDPLGMSATTTNFASVRRSEHASPHGGDERGRISVMPLVMEEGVSSVAPAGAVWSNLVDMEKVLLVELAGGALPSGARFLSEANLLERRKPQVKITDTRAYGLGLFVENDHGVRVMGHGGNNAGFTTDMFFLPDHSTGLVLLSNREGDANIVRSALRRKLLEMLFNARSEAAGIVDFGLTRGAQARKALAEKLQTPDAAWATPWIGRYKSPELGVVTIRREKDKFVIDVGEWKSTLGKKVDPNGPPKWALLDAPWSGEFELLAKESGEHRTLVLEMPQQTYVFEPVGPAPQAHAAP